MSMTFDPNFAPFMQGDITAAVQVTETPNLGIGNRVLETDKPFDVSLEWKTFGQLNPLWLSALAASSPEWVVTIYADPIGPGEASQLAVQKVRVDDAAPYGLESTYSASVTVPAGALAEENPGNPNVAGVYRITATVFLNSTLGGVGYDIIGFAEGPMVKVEDSI